MIFGMWHDVQRLPGDSGCVLGMPRTLRRVLAMALQAHPVRFV